jgi:NAD(P)-dependent dehydrogenase (short-subunit alcohol dehydrogenase family)
VLLCGVSRELAARLARAGFAVLSVDSRTPEDVGMVLDALKGGALSVEGDERVAVVAADEALGRAAAERGVPWCGASGATDEQSVETIVRWLARHLV